MNSKDFDRKILQANLLKAVRCCKGLKTGRRIINSSFTINPYALVDLTDEKYEDGIHSYIIDSMVIIENNCGEKVEERCELHFDAEIEGTDVNIVNGMVIALKDIVPLNW